MERTVYQTFYAGSITYDDLHNVSDILSKEEILEMELKLNSIIGNTLGIPDVQTRALMEKMFRLGYYAAHVRFGDGK